MNMKSKHTLYLLVVVMAGLVSLWGCPKKAEVTTAPETQAASGAQKAIAANQERNAEEERAMAATEGLKPISFDFDKSFIRKDAVPVMRANAAWLKANPNVKVRIEGNCDERGTKEYNQALGQRRATSARKYLTDMGVSRSRISLISYGKEKPICSEQSEACWQKNRRDDFVVMK
jgi:peptidoglycan-associated lipoprotein